MRTAYIVPDPDHGPERELRDLPARVGPAATTKANEERTLFPPACRQPATRNGYFMDLDLDLAEWNEEEESLADAERWEDDWDDDDVTDDFAQQLVRKLLPPVHPSCPFFFFFFAAELTPPPPSRSRCSVLAEDGAGEGRQGAQQVRVRLPCTIKPHTPAAAVDSQKQKQRRGKPFLYSYTRPRGLPRPPSFLSSLHSRSVPQVSLLLA